jgi:HEAT repeat protein
MYALKDRLLPDMRRDALVRDCSDGDELVRRNAIEKLAELRDERDTPLLLRALDDRDEHVRLEAIYAVKHRLQPHMRDALIKACGDSDSSVRRKAFETLAELEDESDTQLLVRGLKDPDSIVRMEAVDAIDRRSAGSWSQLNGPLLEAMKDEDAQVRQLAVRLFGRLQQPAVEGSSAARRSGAA